MRVVLKSRQPKPDTNSTPSPACKRLQAQVCVLLRQTGARRARKKARIGALKKGREDNT